MTSVLRVTDVEFGYHPGKPVLRDISFEVSPGEVFIILGANGCGKSTLMRTILGEHKPTSGSITIGGYAAPTSISLPLTCSRATASCLGRPLAPILRCPGCLADACARKRSNGIL